MKRNLLLAFFALVFATSVAWAQTLPTITSTPFLTANVGSDYHYDGDDKVEASGSQPITFSVDGPEGMTIDPDDGHIHWHPEPDQVGPNDITITATNAFGFDTQSFTVEVFKTITLTAVNPPITIPAQGGQFSVVVDIVNMSGRPVTTQVWNAIRKPDGTILGRTPIGPITISLNNGETVTGNPTQTVPANAPPGIYTYIFSVGAFRQFVTDRDSITFTKLAGPIASLSKNNTTTDWEVSAGPQDQLFKFDSSTNEQRGAVIRPETLILEQNYPNPFNPSTIIRFGLNQDAHVTLKIYNILGEEVAILVDEFQSSGFKSMVWDGHNSLGQTVSAGVYLYKLEAGGLVKTSKMVFMK